MRILTFLLIFLGGCGMSPSGRAPVPKIHVEPELQEFMATFDAYYGRESYISTFFDDIGPEIVGLCYRSRGHITIDQAFWAGASTLEREALVLHEYGHCVLRLGHREDLMNVPPYGDVPASVMTIHTIGGRAVYQGMREYYFNELKR